LFVDVQILSIGNGLCHEASVTDRSMSTLMSGCEWRAATLPCRRLSVPTWISRHQRETSIQSLLTQLVTSRPMFQSTCQPLTMSLLSMLWLMWRWDTVVN